MVKKSLLSESQNYIEINNGVTVTQQLSYEIKEAIIQGLSREKSERTYLKNHPEYGNIVSTIKKIPDTDEGDTKRIAIAEFFLETKEPLSNIQKECLLKAHKAKSNVVTINILRTHFHKNQYEQLVELGICGWEKVFGFPSFERQVKIWGREYSIMSPELDSSKVEELLTLGGIDSAILNNFQGNIPILNIEDRGDSYTVECAGQGALSSRNEVRTGVSNDNSKIELFYMNTSYTPKLFSGSKVLQNIVINGKMKGYQEVTMRCGGQPYDGIEDTGNGYYVRPILGVEELESETVRITDHIKSKLSELRGGKFKEELRSLLIRSYKRIYSGSIIQDLYRIPGGRGFWKKYGCAFDGHIVLDSNHPSYKRIASYKPK